MRYAAAAFVLALWPDVAVADGFDGGPFVYGSPGGVAVPIGDDDMRDALLPSFQWAAGGGFMVRPKPKFVGTLGATLEHVVYIVDSSGRWGEPEVDARGSLFRLMPELRLGGGTNKVFGYGVVALGFAATQARVRGESPPGPNPEAPVPHGFDPGLAAGFGGGVLGIVWKNLAIGAEAGVDFAVLFGDRGDDDGPYGAHFFDVKLIGGWFF